MIATGLQHSVRDFVIAAGGRDLLEWLEHYTFPAEARFAALVLLALLILARSAVRVTHGPVAALAIAGLGGVPPLGVFSGLVLAVLTLSAHDP